MPILCESEALARCMEFIGRTTSKQLKLLRATHFSAEHLTRELGSFRAHGHYLIAFCENRGHIRHFTVQDDTGQVAEMEDL
ncbi:hypothetical protein [Gimesia aquarii]|uniref:Uncharacterized protein n=1 Tax=Gimesia aquarii TaxID=2527964 RepID=A0A517VUC8_9PLAN|nr:hypothetical protein [Gimesia aquarii]QDT96611.1 hypothetical protein V144x_20690 [Gimesia aquarii]